VVYGNERTPGYIGDMPHSWAGADFLNLARTIFAWENGEQLVLGLGLDEAWLQRPEGVSVRNLPTHFGPISYAVTASGETVTASVRGDLHRTPAAGIVFHSPRAAAIRSVTVNGKPSRDFTGNTVQVTNVPAELVISY